MTLEELQRGAGSDGHLIEAGSNQVALPDGDDETEEFSRLGAADYPGMLPGIPVQHLAFDLLASPNGRR